MSVVVDPL